MLKLKGGKGGLGMILCDAQVYVDGRFDRCEVQVEGGHIVDVGAQLCGHPRISLHGAYLLPGLIDLHTHGAFGCSAMGSEEELRRMACALPQTGVTAFVPTIGCAPIDEMRSALQRIDAVRLGPACTAAQVLGAHLEGPFLADTHLGALRGDCLLPPCIDVYEVLCGAHGEAVRMLTLSPEVRGALPLASLLSQRGVCVCAGHTGATYAQMLQARQAGVRHITHLFNAMAPLHHRAPGVPAAGLLDDATVELICDGVHLHEAVLQLVARCKPPEQICLVTDAIPAAGLSDGLYTLAGLPVRVQGGVARLCEKGSLAGSTLTMHRALLHMAAHSGLPFAQVVGMATQVPARELGDHTRGRIAAGLRADFCILSPTRALWATIVGGTAAFMDDDAPFAWPV